MSNQNINCGPFGAINELSRKVEILDNQINLTGFNTRAPNAEIRIGPNSTILQDGVITFSNGKTVITPNNIVTDSLTVKSINGQTGLFGATGAQGPIGPQGATGAQGATGVSPAVTIGITQLVDGLVTVNNVSCTESSIITLTYLQPISNPGILSVSNIISGQFVINSSSGTDSSYVQWFLLNSTDTSTPTVTTGSLTTPNPAQFSCSGNVTTNGNSSITERGFVWSVTNPLPTTADSKETAPLGYGLGDYKYSWFDDSTELTYVRAYASNTIGTGYGEGVTGRSFLCLAKGTMIKLENGTEKQIENIKYSDKLMVWNFDQGKFDAAFPLWIKKVETAPRYNLLSFSDHSILKTIDQHRIFNKEKGCFTYCMTDDTPLGTTTFTLNGEIQLTRKEIIKESIQYFNIITDHHFNMFANGILTSCRYNNIYPIMDMKFIKNTILNNTNQNNLIDPIYFKGLRLSEQSFSLSENMNYVDRLFSMKQPKILFLDHQGVMYTKKHPDHKTLDSFNPECIKILNKILETNSNIEIVVSSDWKYWVPLETMQQFYKDQGIHKQPIDYTPSTKNYSIKNYAEQRSIEIKTWVEKNSINEWVAIDDLNMSNFLNNFVWIQNSEKGLENSTIEKILSIL